MAFIKESLDDIHEGEAVPEGEYDLRIVKAAEKKSKKGNDMIQVSIKIEDSDYPNASVVNHWLLSPEGADPEIAHLRLLEFKRFCVLFDLDFDCDAEDMVGATCSGFLDQDTSDEDDTIYNRLRTPRLKD